MLRFLYFSTLQIAERFEVEPRNIIYYIQQGYLIATMVDGQYQINVKDLEKFEDEYYYNKRLKNKGKGKTLTANEFKELVELVEDVKNNIPFEEEILTMEQQMNEAILISLRTSEGLGLENFSKKFGKNNAEKLLQNAQKFIAQKKMIFYNQRLVLQDEGKFLADGIAADLFF